MHVAQDAQVFPQFLVLIPRSTKKNITMITYHFISSLFNVYLPISNGVANDVAYDVAKRLLPVSVDAGINTIFRPIRIFVS